MSGDLTATRWLQREYQTLIDKVPCYVTVVHRDLRVVRANERFRETFGAARGEHCYALFKGRHEPCESCPVLMTFADGRGHTSRHVGVAASGATTHYVVSTEPLQRDGGRVSHVIGMALDITQEHRLQEEQALANLLRQALVENTPAAIVVVNAERRVVVVKGAAEVSLGHSRGQLLGRWVPPGLVPALARGVLFGRRDHCVIAETEIVGVVGNACRCASLGWRGATPASRWVPRSSPGIFGSASGWRRPRSGVTWTTFSPTAPSPIPRYTGRSR